MVKKALIFFLVFFVINLYTAGPVHCQDDSTCQEAPPPFAEPAGDNPDDTFAVDAGNPPLDPPFISDQSAIVFRTGYYQKLLSLLNKTKSSYVEADNDTPYMDLLDASKLLIISSGGLYGLENSEMFKAQLSEYVKNGGNLIVFAQQHGYEFSLLPVPQETDGSYKTISGYGWTEDQSCFAKAVYMDTWHQMLSSVTNSTPSISVDGYFSNFPSNTTVLLRRTANGQPALIMYDYGQGKVIVTSMYSDFAYSHSQASSEEISIVRDMVTWAKKPALLPEIRSGQAVSLTLEAKNVSQSQASSIKLLIYDPDRLTLLSEQTQALDLPAGSVASIQITYSSLSNAPPGIYHIDYALYDANGTIIQPQAETDSGRFVVSNPIVNPYKSPDFNFVVNSDSENYAKGSDAVFTLTLFNSTTADRVITAKYFFPHHWWETYEAQYGGDWSRGRSLNITKTLTIPANSSVSFAHTLQNARASADRLWAYFYDENGKQVGMASRGFYVFQPKVDITVTSDKERYLVGETVNLLLNLKNTQAVGSTSTVKIRVTDPNNALFYENSLNINMSPGGSASQSLNINLPASAPLGFYVATVEAYDPQGNKIGAASKSFEVPSALLSVKALLPASYPSNSTFNAAFEVSNIEMLDVPSASLKVTFTDPNGNVIYDGTQSFSIAVGQAATFTYNVPTGPVVFGDYSLKYVIRYGDKVALAEKKLKRAITMQYRPAKPSYAAGSSFDFTLNVYNNGVFVDNLPFSVNVPSIGFTRSDSISPLPGQSIDLLYSTPIPTSVLSGKYLISAELFTGQTGSHYFQVPNPKLSISLPPVTTAQAGETLTIGLRNAGGGASDQSLSVELRDAKGLLMQRVISSGLLNAGSGITASLVVPSGALSGAYTLIATATDRNSPAGDFKSTPLTITGVAANLSVQTEKTSYIGTEGINSFADITNTGMSIANASLDLKVIPALTPGTLRGTVINSTTGIAIGGAKISVGDKVTYTTSNGQYLLSGIPIGPQRVTIASTGFDRVFADMNIIEAGQTFDAVMSPSKFGTLKGLLKDSLTGDVLVGAKVEVKPKDVLSEEQSTRRISSGFDGRFTVSKIAIGTYTLRFTPDGYTPLEMDVTVSEGTSDNQYLIVKSPSNDPAPTTGEISGRVINQSTGAVLLGVEVKLDSTTADRTPLNEKMYHFYNIQPGAHNLSVSYTGYDDVSATVDIVAGKQSYDIYLTPSVYGDLSGIIKDAASAKPLVGAKVEITPVSVPSADRLTKKIYSGFAGSYAWSKFPAGTYSIRVTKQFYTEFNATITIQAGTLTYNVDLQLSGSLPAASEIEPNGSYAQSTNLLLDVSTTGTFNPVYDYDYYNLTLPGPGTLKVTLSDIVVGGYGHMKLIKSGGAALVDTGDVAGPGPIVMNYNIDAAGTYFVYSNMPYSGSQTSPYKIKAEFVPLDEDVYSLNEPNNTSATATTLPLGTIVLGAFWPTYDYDYYTVTLSGPGSIKVTLNDIPSVAVGGYGHMRLVSSTGSALVDTGDVAGPGPIVMNYNIASAGTYYIYSNMPFSGIQTSPYKIKAEFVPLDEDVYSVNEPNNTAATATTLPLGTTMVGAFWPTYDYDYYTITLSGPGSIKVTLSDIPSAAVGGYGHMRLIKSGGAALVDTGDVPGPGPIVMSYNIDSAGTYYIYSNMPYSGIQTSLYKIKAEFVPLDEDPNEPNNTMATAITLPLGTTMLGYFYPAAEYDWYKVAVSSPGTLKMTLSDIPSVSVGGYMDMTLFRGDNSILSGTGSVPGPGPAVLNYTVTVAGDYYIRSYMPAQGIALSPYRIKAEFVPTSLPAEQVLFTKTISPVNLSGSQRLTTAIPAISLPGKYLLKGTLKSNTSQSIAESSYPFYIVSGNVALLIGPDKKLYKKGEVITLSGEARNLSSAAISGISLSLSIDGQIINSELFDLPAGASHPITFSLTAATDGVFTLKGKLTQNNVTLAEIVENYEVASPLLTATVSVPEVAGADPFTIGIELKNTAKVEASVHYDILSLEFTDSQTVIIPAGETRLISYDRQIAVDTQYTFTFTGDLNESETRAVSYGLAATIALNPQPVYQEGRVAIPVTITNTGLLDETVSIDFNIQPGTSIQTRSYYLPQGSSASDTLYADLTEGSYQITAFSGLPLANATASFVVRKADKAAVSLSAGAQTDASIPVTANLSNLGYNNISGSVRLLLSNSEGTTVWSGTQDVLSLLSQNSQSMTFNVNVATLPAGTYNLKVELLDSANQKLAEQTASLAVQAAAFAIVQLPAYRTFNPDDAASFEFRVRNTGNQAGPVELGFKAYDAAQTIKREWLAAGEEKSFIFNMAMPSDLEAKDYFADYELKTGDTQLSITKGQIKYHLAGINLSVNASLDKQTYAVGDAAHLTISIQSASSTAQPLFARVNYAGFENQQTFTLNGSTTLTFDIPLSQITGEKLFYGIYHESGRSIHLNSLYIYKAGDVITITTNKQVYNPGETVSVSVTGNAAGSMILTGPGYSETFDFSGTASKSFALSQTMTAGTYSISADLTAADGQTYSAKYPVDVAGIQVKVLECKNDKGKYASSDTISTELTVSSNTTMPAVLKTWIVDPEGKYTAAGETSINLNATDNALVSRNSALLTTVSGIHRLVYGIYSGDLLLVSGSEAFDVGDAVLLGLKTDKTDYPTNTESVKATATIYGSLLANMELQLDGITVKNDFVLLDGFSTLELDLGIVTPGSHVLKGILTTGGLKSTKETSFVYGSNLPDLTAGLRVENSVPDQNNTLQITTTVANQGRTASAATTLALYDNDSLIETKQVNALNSGETQDVTFSWNVLGKTGSRILKAVVDPDNLVIELNETNNTVTMNIEIPDLSLVTGTDKDIYKINQNAQISAIVRNLSSEKTFSGLTLITSAKDPAGNEVYVNTAILTDILPLGTKTDTAVWNTTGLTTEGVYTISQQVVAGAQVLAQGTKTVTLKKASDFSMAMVSDHLSVRQGEQVTYTVNLAPLNGWVSPIILSLTGLPAGATVSFNPGNLVPPGQAQIVITTSSNTPAGSYTLTLTADGTDDGDHMTHALPLILDISDATPPAGSLMINNNDAFTKTATVVLTLIATDESGVAKMCISNSATCTAWENYAASRSWSLSSGDESKTVSVWYQDSIGNSNTLPYTATITLDTTAPFLTVSTLADGRWTNNELLNISGEVTDQSGIRELTINNVTVAVNSDGSFGCPVLLVDGPNTIVTKATDLAGNETADTRTMTLDRGLPNITILTPADNLKTNQAAVNVTGTVDEASTVSIKVNDSTPLAALMDGNNFSLTVTPYYGINTIEATAIDLAGNSTTAKRTVTFDDIKPLLSVTDPAQDVKTNQANMTIKGEVQDLTSISVTITMDANIFSPVISGGRFEQSVFFSEQMTYQINVDAVDEAGNVSTVQRHVLFDTTGPVVTLNPVTSPTSLSSQVLTGTMELGATVSVTCPTATVSAVTYPTATTWTATLTGMQQGNNDITVTAVDEVGNVSMPVSATISVSTGNAITNTSPARVWIGLKNSDDQGTQFDLRAELYLNGVLVSTGETLCITGVTRNAALAKEISVPFASVSGGSYSSGDTLSLRILTRIGSTPDGLKCSGPGGSHNNAVGLRMYYDSADRPSKFGAEIVPNPLQDLFLHSSGTSYFLNNIAPTSTVKYKDSAAVNFNNGNLWQAIGTWIMILQ